jgi:hypothetical protein
MRWSNPKPRVSIDAWGFFFMVGDIYINKKIVDLKAFILCFLLPITVLLVKINNTHGNEKAPYRNQNSKTRRKEWRCFFS